MDETVPRSTHIRKRRVLLEFAHAPATQLGPGLPLLETGVALTAAEVHVSEGCQASMHALCVVCQRLANLRDKAAGGRLTEIGKQLPGLQDAVLPRPRFIVRTALA